MNIRKIALGGAVLSLAVFGAAGALPLPGLAARAAQAAPAAGIVMPAGVEQAAWHWKKKKRHYRPVRRWRGGYYGHGGRYRGPYGRPVTPEYREGGPQN